MSTAFATRPTLTTQANSNTPKDIEVVDPPSDSVSRIAFSPVADILAVASWNGEIRLYEVSPQGQSRPVAMYKHEGPVLDISWSNDGSRLFSGGADKTLLAYDLTSGQTTQVGEHPETISCVRYFDSPTGGIVASGSWDKTIKYWNLRQTSPVAEVKLPERCYSMDIAYPLLVAATADRHVVCINLTDPTTILKTLQSPLKWQTRTVACAPSGKGFAIGSVEGRVAIQYIDARDASLNFSFRCHRKEPTPKKEPVEVYAVNNIIYHHEYGTFLTCGSDGSISSWDGDSKIRLKTFDSLGGPIVSSAFDRTGNILAYAVSYDWSKGHGGMTPGHVNKVFLHACKDDEIKRRPKSK